MISHGVPVTYLGNTFWQRLIALKHLLSDERFDLLHSCLFSSDMLARFISAPWFRPTWRLSCSIVNNSYGPQRREDHGVKPWKLELVKLVDRISHRIARPKVHAVTLSAGLNAAEHLVLAPQDITVVYRGRPEVKVNDSRDRLRVSLGIPGHAFVFIHVARQEHQKNHLGLITAFEQVWQGHPDTRLLLVGRDGNTSAEVRHRLADSPAKDAIQCLGHRTDVVELLHCADAFVLPSHFEGLSGAMIEAMEAGLPVVCSDLDGLREGCEPDRSALLCDPKRPDTIASTMNRLLDDRDLTRRLGARGHEIFLERFTLEASCQGMLSFFDSVVAKGSRAGRSAH